MRMFFNSVVYLFLVVTTQIALAQQPYPLSFYPYKAGNIWQYRSLYTGELVGTRYIDSIRVDSLSRDIFIFFGHRPGGGTPDRERLDSVFNVYNLNFHSDYPRYKLAADSGESWIAGYEIFNEDTFRTFLVSVTGVFHSYVFDSLTTVKVFRFDMIQFGGKDTFWLGNDYLAAGFGLVRTDIEPSDVYYLAGAIIDSKRYGVIVGVSEDNQLMPQEFQLHQNYPNPFNASTVIRYELTEKSNVVLKIYNMLGQEVTTLVNDIQNAGEHVVLFNAQDLPSGVYFYKLQSGTFLEIKKMLLLK